MPDHRFLKDSVASPLLRLLQAEAAAASCLRDARVPRLDAQADPPPPARADGCWLPALAPPLRAAGRVTHTL